MTKQKDESAIADISNTSRRSVTIDGKQIFIDDYEGDKKAFLENMALAIEIKKTSIANMSMAHYELLSALLNMLLNYLAQDFAKKPKEGDKNEV